MKWIGTILQRLYYRLAVITNEYLCRRIGRQIFCAYFDANDLHYRISSDRSRAEASYELSGGELTTVIYDFSSYSGRIVIQSHFLEIEEHQFISASLMAAHINLHLRTGAIKINFQEGRVYYEEVVNHATLLLHPKEIETLNPLTILLSDDFLWCFRQVLDVQEEPVVVMGELIRKRCA